MRLAAALLQHAADQLVEAGQGCAIQSKPYALINELACIFYPLIVSRLLLVEEGEEPLGMLEQTAAPNHGQI